MNEWKNTVNIQGYFAGRLCRNPAAYGFGILSQRWYLCTHMLFTGYLTRTCIHTLNILPHLLLQTKKLGSETLILLKFTAPTSLHTCKVLISLRFAPPTVSPTDVNAPLKRTHREALLQFRNNQFSYLAEQLYA